MTSLAEQLREFIDTLNELGPTAYDKDHMGRVRYRKKSNVVPGTSGGVLAELVLKFADDMVIKMDSMEKLDEETKQIMMSKLQELVEFAQNDLSKDFLIK